MVNVNKFVSNMKVQEFAVEHLSAMSRAVRLGIPRVDLERLVKSDTFARNVAALESETGKTAMQMVMENFKLLKNTTFGEHLKQYIGRVGDDIRSVRNGSIEDKQAARDMLLRFFQ